VPASYGPLADPKLLLRLRQIHLGCIHPSFLNLLVHLVLDCPYFDTRPQLTIRAQQLLNILLEKTTSYGICRSTCFLEHCFPLSLIITSTTILIRKRKIYTSEIKKY